MFLRCGEGCATTIPVGGKLRCAAEGKAIRQDEHRTVKNLQNEGSWHGPDAGGVVDGQRHLWYFVMHHCWSGRLSIMIG